MRKGWWLIGTQKYTDLYSFLITMKEISCPQQHSFDENVFNLMSVVCFLGYTNHLFASLNDPCGPPRTGDETANKDV